MSEKLNDEELKQVSGGSHIAVEDIHNYAGRDLIYSEGIFGWDGSWTVHINDVHGTWVNMTFTDPNMPEWAEKGNGHGGWISLGNATFEWDYDDQDFYWLE